MKNIIILIFALFAFNTFAAPVEVDVLSAEYGVEDHFRKKTLCLTVVRIPSNGALVGIVEGIYDCFIARSAKKSPNHKVRVDFQRLRQLEIPALHSHLQSLDTQLKFLFSEGE